MRFSVLFNFHLRKINQLKWQREEKNGYFSLPIFFPKDLFKINSCVCEVNDIQIQFQQQATDKNLYYLPIFHCVAGWLFINMALSMAIVLPTISNLFPSPVLKSFSKSIELIEINIWIMKCSIECYLL